jgi:hypothetical protein
MASGLDPEFPGDETNPYAPPKSEIGRGYHGETLGVVPFDLGSILSATWTLYKERLGACLGVCWTVIALMWGAQFVQVRLLRELAPAPGDRLQFFLVQFTVFFVGYVLNLWLSIGQNLALLGLARRESSVFERVFRGGRYLLTTILAGILFVLALGVIVLTNVIWIPTLGGILGPGTAGAILVSALGIGVAIVASLYVAARFSQFAYMILDHNAGVVDSLRFSWQATRRRVGTLILVFAMVLLINLGGLLACFVGMLSTAPYTSLMLVVTYLSLTGQPLGDGKQETEYWDGAEKQAPEDWDEEYLDRG